MRPVWYHPIPLVTSFRVEANIELKGFPNKALLTCTSGKSRVLSGLWKQQGKYCCCLLSIFYRCQATEAMSKSFSTIFFHHGALKKWCHCVYCLLFLSVPTGREGWEEPLTHPGGCPHSCPQGSPSVESCFLHWVTCTRSFGEFVAELQMGLSQP